MIAVRWVLVPVTAFAVWFGTLLVGIGGSSLLDALCPPDLMISGICTAPWHGPAMTALETMCAAVAAVGFVALPAMVPRALWAPSAVAAIAGVITLWLTISRSRRRSVDRNLRQQSAVGQ